MRDKSIKDYHRALRDHWKGSAPMELSDDRLTLFGITNNIPENLIYLVWKKEGEEPEVWLYAGMESHTFKNLEHFFRWYLERI